MNGHEAPSHAVHISCMVSGCNWGRAGGPDCTCAPDAVSATMLDQIRDDALHDLDDVDREFGIDP